MHQIVPPAPSAARTAAERQLLWERSIALLIVLARQARAARDAIPALERRFNPEALADWRRLDDLYAGLDAALTDAGVRLERAA